LDTQAALTKVLIRLGGNRGLPEGVEMIPEHPVRWAADPKDLQVATE
jgi:hypothetical protein